MSEQRHNDDFRDSRVSDAYRDLSNEQTSAALDEKVLDMANAGKPKRSLTRLLAIKPLAWAATVVLTVSLVLHVNQAPTPDTLLFEEDVTTDAVPLPSENSGAAIRESQFTDVPASIGRQDDVAAETAGAFDSAAKDADVAAEPRSFAPAAATRAKMQEVDEFIAERERATVSLPDNAEATVSIQGRQPLAAPESRYCSDAQTADASSWYRCILALEKDGKLDEAAAERTRLFSKYPDFEVR